MNTIDSANPLPVSAGENGIKSIARSITAPVLTPFVWWVLKEALERKIKRLYFLARDGYIMYRIAMLFCEKFGLGIECRYLYGSRTAWRTAVCHFNGEEKFRHIFAGGSLVTPRIILERVQADKTQRYHIYKDIQEDPFEEDRKLSVRELKAFAGKLTKSVKFNEYLQNISAAQFNLVSGYLRQEGLFDGGEIAIVDSGWTGSVQRTLRQIAERNMQNPRITGFYFGLYTDSGDAADGEYNAWYFSGKSPVQMMAKFNSNVFECMCAAPFDMTAGYELADSKYAPVFQRRSSSGYNIETAERQNQYIEVYAAEFISGLDFNAYNASYLDKSKRILQSFMTRPGKEEARALGKFTFCDDASNAYERKLASPADARLLKNYTVLRRASNKLWNASGEAVPGLFWFHGSAALSDVRGKNWYRFNYWLWETARITVKKYINLL